MCYKVIYLRKYAESIVNFRDTFLDTLIEMNDGVDAQTVVLWLIDAKIDAYEFYQASNSISYLKKKINACIISLI